VGISGRAAIRKHYVSVTFGFMEEACTFAILHDFRGFHIKKRENGLPLLSFFHAISFI